jgi:hypothetical protein
MREPLLFLLFSFYAHALIVVRLALGMVEDHPDCLLARGVVRCNVEAFLSTPWALASQLVDQALVGGPG